MLQQVHEVRRQLAAQQQAAAQKKVRSVHRAPDCICDTITDLLGICCRYSAAFCSHCT